MMDRMILKDIFKLLAVSLIIGIIGFYLDYYDWKENTTFWNSKAEIGWFSLMIFALISAFYFPIKYNRVDK